MTEYHPIQQTLGKDTLLNSSVEPFETPHFGQIKKDRPRKISIFAQEELKVSHLY
jgi:hypothetical protein